MPAGRAYAVANKVEQELVGLQTESVTAEQLRDLTLEVLRNEAVVRIDARRIAPASDY